MDFTLKPLPYSKNALEPHLGKQTLALHYDKHHAGYLKKLKQLIEGKPEANESLEWILCSAEGPVFENAAQVWNHDFYWRSMHPDGGGKPDDALGDAVDGCFGGLDGLRKIFLQAGKDHFGSGWIWLIGDRGRLRVTTTHDANLPLRYGQVPLVTADLWEHAYYLDYHNERARYLEAFFDHLINWEFAASNWTAAAAAPATVVRRSGVTS